MSVPGTLCRRRRTGARTRRSPAASGGCDLLGQPVFFRPPSQDAPGHATYFSFDAVGNQNAVTTPLGHTAYYGYDDMAGRVSTQESAGVTYYDWDGINTERAMRASVARPTGRVRRTRPAPRRAGNVIQEKDASGSVTGRQVHGYAPIPSVGDIALMDKGASGVYVPISDQVGTVWPLLDSTGAVVNTYSYDAFGVGGATTEAVSNLYRFGTKRLDDSGLYHFIARQFSPWIGRYASPDLAVLVGGRYASQVVGGRLSTPVAPLGGSRAKRDELGSGQPYLTPPHLPRRWSNCKRMDPSLRKSMECVLRALGYSDSYAFQLLTGTAPLILIHEPTGLMGPEPIGGVTEMPPSIIDVYTCESSDPDNVHGEFLGYIIIAQHLVDAFAACEPGEDGEALGTLIHEASHRIDAPMGGGLHFVDSLLGTSLSQAQRSGDEVLATVGHLAAAQIGWVTCCGPNGSKHDVSLSKWKVLMRRCGVDCPLCEVPNEWPVGARTGDWLLWWLSLLGSDLLNLDQTGLWTA